MLCRKIESATVFHSSNEETVIVLKYDGDNLGRYYRGEAADRIIKKVSVLVFRAVNADKATITPFFHRPGWEAYRTRRD
jgi:hypothetical protein